MHLVHVFSFVLPSKIPLTTTPWFVSKRFPWIARGRIFPLVRLPHAGHSTTAFMCFKFASPFLAVRCNVRVQAITHHIRPGNEGRYPQSCKQQWLPGRLLPLESYVVWMTRAGLARLQSASFSLTRRSIIRLPPFRPSRGRRQARGAKQKPLPFDALVGHPR